MINQQKILLEAIERAEKDFKSGQYGDHSILLKPKDDIKLKKIENKIVKNVEPNFPFINETHNFPKDIDKLYYEQTKAFWTVDDVQIDYKDIEEFKNLNPDVKNVCLAILLFFNVADKLVISNISALEEVRYERAKHFYYLQLCIELIHDQIYVKCAKIYMFIKDSIDNTLKYENDTNLLNNIINLGKELKDYEFNLDDYECEWLNNKDETEKKIFKAVSKKINLINRWKNVNSYVHNLVAFFVIESLCFSTLFTIIRLFKNNAKGLSYFVDINNRVEIDENLHSKYGITIYKNYVMNKLSNQELKDIITEIADVEIQFLTDILPPILFGKNREEYLTYTKEAANNLYREVAINSTDVIYEYVKEVDPSFKYQPNVSIKSNFFERQPIYAVNGIDVTTDMIYRLYREEK